MWWLLLYLLAGVVCVLISFYEDRHMLEHYDTSDVFFLVISWPTCLFVKVIEILDNDKGIKNPFFKRIK